MRHANPTEVANAMRDCALNGSISHSMRLRVSCSPNKPRTLRMQRTTRCQAPAPFLPAARQPDIPMPRKTCWPKTEPTWPPTNTLSPHEAMKTARRQKHDGAGNEWRQNCSYPLQINNLRNPVLMPNGRKKAPLPAFAAGRGA